jgi:uncharacterized protein (TIGR03435 family)
MTRTDLTLLIALIAGVSFAQTPESLRFEVATVKPSGPEEIQAGVSGIKTGHGRATGTDVTLKRCIIGSFHVGPNQIVGGPDWLDTDRFHIEAKADQPANDDAVLDAMLRNLLADRFHLAVHRELRTMSALVLEVGKNGPKLEQGDGGEAVTDSGRGQLKIRNESMDDFAERLARIADLPVVNRTGLSGVFNLKLFWAPDDEHRKPDDPPSLFTAIQEQLGLRLTSGKSQVPVLVIDHAERPGDN